MLCLVSIKDKDGLRLHTGSGSTTVKAKCTEVLLNSDCATTSACQSVCNAHSDCAWKDALFPWTGGFSVPGYGCFASAIGGPAVLDPACTDTLRDPNCSDFPSCEAQCNANGACAWKAQTGDAFPWSSYR